MPLTYRSRIAGYLARVRYAGKAARAKARGRSRTVRRARGLRASRLMKYNVHSYKRWATSSEFSLPANTTSSVTSYTFDLNKVQGSAELQALYDQYQITGVKVQIQLINNPSANRQLVSDAANNTANVYPKIWMVRDYDDTGTETISSLQQRNNAKSYVLAPNRLIKFFVRPAVRGQVYLDGVTQATTPEWNKWIDCSSGGVPHHGIKIAMDSLNSLIPQAMFVRIDFCYYLKFKNVR